MTQDPAARGASRGALTTLPHTPPAGDLRTRPPGLFGDGHDMTDALPLRGHNVGEIAVDRLRSIVERIERLNLDRKEISSEIKDAYIEAKFAGFDAKVVKQLIRIRSEDANDVEQQETLLDVYRRALGM